MAVGLIVASTVLVVLAVVAAAGYLIDGSVPDDEGSPEPHTVQLP